MEDNVQIDVDSLAPPHRQALEEVMGRELAPNQRLVIQVVDSPVPQIVDPRPAQTVADWAKVYDGLTDQEIEEIDKIINTRANLHREFPDL